MTALCRVRLLVLLPVWLVVALVVAGGVLAQYAAFTALLEAAAGWQPGPLPAGDGPLGTVVVGVVALAAAYLTLALRRRYERLALPHVGALSGGWRAAAFLFGGVAGVALGAVIAAPLVVFGLGDAAVLPFAVGWGGAYVALDVVVEGAGVAPGEE